MSDHSSRVMSPADGGGPSTNPPTVPEGWLAQWESRHQRWYYVQRATGVSQWDVPTEPFFPTPSSTPQSMASPGPFGAPQTSIPHSDDEATKELKDVRTGKNRYSNGGNYPSNAYVHGQSSPLSGQAHQNPSPGLQRTPVAGGSNMPSRSSSQGMFRDVVTDLATRSATSDVPGTQQSPPQNSQGYSVPSQTVTPGSEYMNPQHPQNPQQPMNPMQGYPNLSETGMDLGEQRTTPQEPNNPNNAYGGPDIQMTQHVPQTTPDNNLQQTGYFPPHQNTPVDPMAGYQQSSHGHPGAGAPVSTGSPYQPYGQMPPPPGPQQAQYGGQMQPPPGYMPQPQAPDSGIVQIQSNPDRPLFPIPYSEAQIRKREMQEGHAQPRNYQPGPSSQQPFHDSRYQHTSERPQLQGHDPRAAQGRGYYGDNGQGGSYPARDHAFQQGMPQQQPTGSYYHEPRGGEFSGYNHQPAPDQRAQYDMHRQTSQGSGPWPQQHDQGPPPPAQTYPPTHQQRYSGGGYPAGRGR